ncbi:AAA family ATPase [Lactiplantibacillus plantarum]|uniref:AAA family ATPase n=1 Tax=Lactiplantibacillus plantarum TaxID=1590 RepID=UPI002001D1CF|nr:AAA family ATPase [Lactiplantibacillus plantarum]
MIATLNSDLTPNDILQLEVVQQNFKKMNKFFGSALTPLNFPDHTVLGRERELHDLSIIMARRSTPVAILLGEAGVGKTDIVESWNEQESKKGKHIYLYTLAVGALSAQGPSILQERMEALMPKLREFEDYLKDFDSAAEVVLFIDEVHTVVSIFGAGTKLGGDLLKRSLARNYIRVIAATTRDEYDTYIANDAPLARRFKPLEINEVGPEITLDILKQWLLNHSSSGITDSDNLITEDLLKKIIEANHLYREQFAEPAKSIDVVESALAISDIDKTKVTFETIRDVFMSQYNINLTFKVDPKRINENLVRRVKGQPLALFTLDRLIKQMSMPLERSNRPLATALFVGPTGVGKTEATKALAEGVFGSEDKIINLNMPDFGLATSEPEFRRILGTAVYHQPSAIILLDELEKANLTVLQTLLPVIDEGRLSYEAIGQDGYHIRQTVSLRNTIIIGTSNAGHKFFDQDNRYSTARSGDRQREINELSPELKHEWATTMITLVNALQAESDFTPEFLGRFQAIIPFLGLTDATLAAISDKYIDYYCSRLKEMYGIEIDIKDPQDWESHHLHFTSTEITGLIIGDMLSASDSKAGGARNVKRLVDTAFYGPVLDAMYDPENQKKNVHHFEAKLNGKQAFNRGGATAGSGAVVLVPKTYLTERR